jgi:cytochrome c oxidase subunit 2
MSPEAERGRRIANTSGCASCHGSDGTGGVGPKFVGLYGSEVTLSGRFDRRRRRRVHTPFDHRSRRATGRWLHAEDAVVGLKDDEIEAVLAYIRELGTTP